MGARGLAFSIFLVFIGRMSNGDAALAASGIVVTVMMLAVLPPWVWPKPCRCSSDSTREKTAREIGSRDVERIAGGFDVHPPRGSNVRALSEFFISAGFTIPATRNFGRRFTIVPYLLMYIALFTSFDAMNMVFSFALKGAGDTRFVTLVALMVPWPIMVIAHLSDERLECGLYWAWGAANLFIISQSFVFWRRCRRQMESVSVIG